MKKMTIEMPEVSMCGVEECAYNEGKKCCAHAITIGDLQNPRCDTFFNSKSQIHMACSMSAGVGACKVSSCAHNTALECTAAKIQVDHGRDPADCKTFKKQ